MKIQDATLAIYNKAFLKKKKEKLLGTSVREDPRAIFFLMNNLQMRLMCKCQTNLSILIKDITFATLRVALWDDVTSSSISLRNKTIYTIYEKHCHPQSGKRKN